MSGSPFDVALLEHSTLLEYDSGHTTRLPVGKWLLEPDPMDALLIGRCFGATLDIGCGPGRLTSALTHNGIPAVGIDTSTAAVRMTRDRGGTAVLRDVFDPVPNEGSWRHVLLADGNIGIGGDPARLLDRVWNLLEPGGTALIEVDPPGTGLHRGQARFGHGPWFPWASVDAESLIILGNFASFTMRWSTHRRDRYFLEFDRTKAP